MKATKVARNIAIVVVALIVLIVVGALFVTQTDWFRNYVREKIISSTEESTGGRVEVGAFAFDNRALKADVSDFVIHGYEPPGSAPFLRIGHLQLYIRLFTSIHHLLDVVYLGVDGLQANIMTLPDGQTNIPRPK